MTIRLQPIVPPLPRGISRDAPPNALPNDLLTPFLREVISAHHDLYQRNGAHEPWIGYLALEHSDGGMSVVGACSFKGVPHDAKVETAYFTFPGFERRGFGHQMAASLIEIASRDISTDQVVAHTLAETNASIRILEKLGFTRIGMVDDPEDGPIWRWARRVGDNQSARKPLTPEC